MDNVRGDQATHLISPNRVPAASDPGVTTGRFSMAARLARRSGSNFVVRPWLMTPIPRRHPDAVFATHHSVA